MVWECMDWLHMVQDIVSGGLLWIWYRTFAFHRRRRISWL